MHIQPLIFGIIASLSFVNAADDDESSTSSSSSTSGNPCSFSRTTITEATGIQEINSCATLDGDITITGNELDVLDLPGIRRLDGSLNVVNCPLILNANFLLLENITGSLRMQNMTRLLNIQLPNLNISNDLQLISLPSLETLGINPNIYLAEKVVLSDTALGDLTGFDGFESIMEMNINNNKNITRIEFPNLRTVRENLILSFNNDGASVVMDNLIWAANLTIQDVRSVSLRRLTNVNGSLSFSFNTFESLVVDNVTNVGTSLQIFANDDMNELSFSRLTEIAGEFKMFNNSALQNMSDSFPSLRRVRGALSITGDFEVLRLPDLERVDGDFYMTSTDNDFECEAFRELRDSGNIQGHNYECEAQRRESYSTETGELEGDDTDDENDGRTNTNSNAGGKLFVPGAMISLIAGVLFSVYI